MKRKISLILVITFIVGILSVPVIAATNFPDVPSTHWSYVYVTAIADKGLIAGYPDGNFGPGRNITRAELVTIVVKSAFGALPEGSSHWADNYMRKAVESGLLLPDEFTSDTWNTAILRQDIALVVARAMEVLRKEDPVANTDSYTSKITDWSLLCDACKPYIAQVYAKGIVGGYPDGSFGGGKTATRAEAATMLTRLVDPSYRSVTIGGIGFTRQTDILPDGRMTIVKSLEYMDIILDNLCFYKENGKFYVRGNLPELPEGFENFLNIDWYTTLGGDTYTTEFIVRPEIVIPNTGEFVREIFDMTNTSQLTSLTLVFSIEAKNNKYNEKDSVVFTIKYDRKNIVSVYEPINHNRSYALEYDSTKLFTW